MNASSTQDAACSPSSCKASWCERHSPPQTIAGTAGTRRQGSRSRLAAPTRRREQHSPAKADKGAVSHHQQSPRTRLNVQHQHADPISPSSPSLTISLPSCTHVRLISFAVIILLSILSGTTAATSTTAHLDRHRSAYNPQIAATGDLLVDHRILLAPRQFEQEGLPTTTTTEEPATPTAIEEPTESSSAASQPTATNGPGLTDLPMPFDNNLGSNFSTPGCPNFFTGFLQNATFQSCLPLSMLLENSQGFFEAASTTTGITQTLDATCNVDYAGCSRLMSYYAIELPKENNCAEDQRRGNAVVRQALNGLLAYQTLYQAGCAKDAQGSYCYANAVTNETSPQDVYVYYTALGTDFPGGSRPTCSQCLRDTMAIFNTAAANSSQPVSQTYTSTAQNINMGCGPNYINVTIARLSNASARQSPAKGLMPLLVTTIALIALFL